jgi:hypothetical protein
MRLQWRCEGQRGKGRGLGARSSHVGLTQSAQPVDPVSPWVWLDL